MLSFSRSRRQSARRRRSHRGWNHGDNSEKAPVSEDKGFHPQHATSDVFYSQETSDTTKTIHRCSASNIRHRGCKPTTPAQGRNVNDLFTTKNAYKNVSVQLAKTRRFVNATMKSVNCPGAVLCINPDCPAVKAVQSIRPRDANAAMNIVMAGASELFLQQKPPSFNSSHYLDQPATLDTPPLILGCRMSPLQREGRYSETTSFIFASTRRSGKARAQESPTLEIGGMSTSLGHEESSKATIIRLCNDV
ncbi:hypothetical protein B0O80DRAFT_496600 [Mortierella sp. GBAus27b]|nr:hypothetical protein B0O80DRAFT_496600 [Mortierella sp. GBAus27b]